MLKQCKIYSCSNGMLGLHLSRAPWDPYPWVSGIQKGSSAQRAGMHMGDSILELNGSDVLGQKISEIAAVIREHWQSGASYLTVVLWRNQADDAVAALDGEEEDEGNAQHSINQQSLQKFATCLQHIAQLLECPVCLEVIKPPGWQCCNGHVLCNNCRSRSVKCPVCRVPLGPRGRCLLSDKLFTLLAESFPCNGVKSNRNSPTESRKCTPEYHNQPKMAVANVQQYTQQQQQQQQQIKAKEIKKKVKSLRQQDEKTIQAKFGNEQENENEENESAEMAAAKQQLAKGDVASREGDQNNANSINNNNICLGRPSRTTKVHQHQANEMKILKSHEDKQLSNCSSSSSSSSSKESVSKSPATTMTSSASVSSALVAATHNNNVLVKLKLKSSKKSPEDYRRVMQRAGGQITAGQSHEVQEDDEVTTVNNGMTTNKVQQQQQRECEMQRQQQYQNYHCPTGKSSCCSYVKTTTTIAATIGRPQTFPANSKGGDHPHYNNNKKNTRNLSTSQETNGGWATEDDAAVLSSTKLSNSGSLSSGCNNNNNNNSNNNNETCALRPPQTTTTNACPHSLGTHIPARKSQTTLHTKIPKQNECQHIADKLDAAAHPPPTAWTNTISLSTSAPQLHSEWQIFCHLTQEHRLPVSQFYGTYCQRIQVDFVHNKSMPCLSIVQQQQQQQQQQEQPHPANVLSYENLHNYKVDRFFLACIPLESNNENENDNANHDDDVDNSPATFASYAIFLWHLLADKCNNVVNVATAAAATSTAADVCQFETIIESKRTGIKWFGRSHSLTKSWSQIHAEGQFLMHEMLAVGNESDAFDIVIKIK